MRSAAWTHAPEPKSRSHEVPVPVRIRPPRPPGIGSPSVVGEPPGGKRQRADDTEGDRQAAPGHGHPRTAARSPGVVGEWPEEPAMAAPSAVASAVSVGRPAVGPPRISAAGRAAVPAAAEESVDEVGASQMPEHGGFVVLVV